MQNFTALEVHGHAMLVVLTRKLRVRRLGKFWQPFAAHHLRSMESVDIEPMNVPHRSRIDSSGSHLDDIYAPMIPITIDVTEPEDVQESESRRAQRRLGYFDIHPECRRVHIGGDGDMMDQFAQAASDLEALPRRSDTTDSVYSSGPTPPASPTRATNLNITTNRL